ncbi:hypothetical protein [Winogradskyella sp. A2]|uniref:hypothetical protein n=1 Tax=Winogradskyella sp. A2 TaxID=3366944 RepID=UPI00398C7842
MWTNEFFIGTLISLLIGIISGAFASYVFLTLYLKRKVPNLIIAERISKCVFDGETNYFFKFINKTKSEIFDVRVELTFHKFRGGGNNIQEIDLTLKDSYFAYIPVKSKRDVFNLHAVRVRTEDRIEDMWDNDSSYVRITVIAKHSLSGLSKVYKMDYRSTHFIVNGEYASGDNLNVLTNNN